MTTNVQRKNKIITYSVVAAIAGALIFLSVLWCAIHIMDNYESQLKQNLYDVSSQCAQTLDSQIESRYELLKSVNNRFEREGDNRGKVLDDYDNVVDAFHLKRLGFCDKNGIAYATDGCGADLSYRTFFKMSISGITYISDILDDALESEHEKILIMSMPLRGADTKIEGITCVTYEVSSLSDEFSVKSFDGYGDNFVVNQNRSVIISSNEDILPVASDFSISDFSKAESSENDTADLVLGMSNKETLEGRMNISNRNYYYCMTPVDIMDGNATWYVLSVVSDDYLRGRYNSVRRDLISMMLIVLFIIVVSVLVLRYFFRSQRRLTYSLAFISPLTGGPNLSRFFENLKDVKNKNGYIVYLNLEDFAHTSVAAGIESSNILIKEIWYILSQKVSGDEQACHDKADSFVLFLREESDEALKLRLKSIRDEIHELGHSMDIPWVFPKWGVKSITEDDNVKKAYSMAEYTVFNIWGQKECVSFYNDDDMKKQSLNKSIEDNFENAIEDKDFEVWFQPKYSVSGDKLTGAEALVRWRKKDGSLISPGVFIPLLENSGEIAKLDEYVYRSVLKKLKEWQDSGYELVPVSINVSRATLYRDKIVDTYISALKEYQLDPKYIQLEVTESIVGSNDMIIELLMQFRNSGIKILMDDFGTGYSSLSTLNMKCFDTLKIDKSLVDEIGDEYGRTIIYHTIEMGYSLGLHITVEGVEERNQLDLLSNTKCDDIQGFYFSKPLPDSEFEDKLCQPNSYRN